MNLIVGDSHIKSLENYRNDKNNIIHFSASSIRGLLNHNSKTMAGYEITELANSSKYDKLFIMFGKVDLEWVYPYKLKEKNIDIKNFIEDTIDKYIEFINKISNKFEVVYVMGLHLPSLEEKPMLNFINCASTINNVSSKACIQSNFSKTIKIGSLKERTEEILMFNDILSKKINCEKCYYIDITSELLDKETNTCKQHFIANNDHHLKKNETGVAWYEKHLKYLL